ncbi:MAG: transposase [Methylobacter sp.]
MTRTKLRVWFESRGIKTVIPPKSNRKEKIECDYWHYKERHVVECMFGKLKHYRRIATRYEKKAIKAINYIYVDTVIFFGAFMAEMKRQQNLNYFLYSHDKFVR